MNLQEIRESRSKGVVAYTRFCLDSQKTPNNLFCFFEGEDIKYYGTRILHYTGYDNASITNYSCGGKKQVLKAYSLISKNQEYQDIKKAFFIDKDFDPYDTTGQPEIYQTPSYSIENFYSSIGVLKKILNSEFNLNTSEEDFEKCLIDFSRTQNLYHSYITMFNAWIFFQREKERSEKRNLLTIGDFKISKLFSSISIDDITVHNEINLDFICTLFPIYYENDIDRIEEIVAYFNLQNKQQVLGGNLSFNFLKI